MLPLIGVLKEEVVNTSWTVILIVIAVMLALASLGFGIFCLIRYARTRKVLFLVLGLLLTFLLPGILFCLALAVYIPTAMVVYAPPPDINP